MPSGPISIFFWVKSPSISIWHFSIPAAMRYRSFSSSSSLRPIQNTYYLFKLRWFTVQLQYLNLNTKVLILVVYNFKLNHFLSPQLFIFFYIFMITSFFSVLTSFTFTSASSFNFIGLVVSTLAFHLRELTQKAKPSNSRAASTHQGGRVKPRILNHYSLQQK